MSEQQHTCDLCGEFHPNRSCSVPKQPQKWQCKRCGQVNAGWATKCGRCEQPQEEWTLQRLTPYMGRRDNYKALLDDINAELTAQTELTERWFKDNLRLARELAVERKKLDSLIGDYSRDTEVLRGQVKYAEQQLIAEREKWQELLGQTSARDLAKLEAERKCTCDNKDGKHWGKCSLNTEHVRDWYSRTAKAKEAK